jgi:hypothetical protein
MKHVPEHRSPRNRLFILAAAAAVGLVFVGLTFGATSKLSVAPTNSTQPSLSGKSVEGEKLTANPGTWNGSAPISFQYQWLSCDATAAHSKNIAGRPTRPTPSRSSDVGNTVRVNVIAGTRRLEHGPERPHVEDLRRDHDNYNHHACTVEERLPLPDHRRCARLGPLGCCQPADL